MCLSAIAWARIKNVYYGCSYLDSQSIGFDDHQIYNLFVNPKNSKIKIKTKQIERNACLKLFKEYKSTNHKLY
jgi:guanine deaminase